MPTRAIADQDGVRTDRDLSADLFQMLIHRLGVGVGHDQRGAHRAGGTDGAEDIGGDVSVIAHHQRAGANWGPDVSVRALLPHPRFILEPYFYGAAGFGAGE